MALDVSNICRSAFAVLAPVPRLVKLGFFASTAPVVCLSSEPGWFRALKAVRALAGTVPEAWNLFGDSHGSGTAEAGPLAGGGFAGLLRALLGLPLGHGSLCI